MTSPFERSQTCETDVTIAEPEPEQPTERDLQAELQNLSSRTAQGVPELPAESLDMSPGIPDITQVNSWSTAEVATWLRSVGLEGCVNPLQDRGVAGTALLRLTAAGNPSAELAELGVHALGDRKRLLKALRQLEVDANQVTKGTGGPWALHFMFMCASPLAELGPGSHGTPMKALDVESEQHAISKAMADAGSACRFQHVYATLRTLSWAVVHQSCCVFIFSGHTVAGGKLLLETETGEALPFDPHGLFQQDASAQNAFLSSSPMRSADLHSASRHPSSSSTSSTADALPSTLREASGVQPAEMRDPLASPWHVPATSGLLQLLQMPRSGTGLQRQARFRLVVLHCTHTEATAQRFLEMGVPHVITIERTDDLSEDDVGASAFLQSLCQSLLLGCSVKQAFDRAETVHRHTELSGCTVGASSSAALPRPRSQHQKRLALLPEGVDHNEVLMAAVPRGSPMRCSPARAVGQFPRTGFDLTISHRAEMWRVLRALRFRRLVQVLGAPGVGKRTLACLVANYVWQRHLFPDGVHYAHISDLFQLSALAAATADPSSNEEGDGEEQGGQTPTFLNATPELLGQKLLILDGCEGLYAKRCHNRFIDWISRMLTANPKLQLLITASTRLPVSSEHSGDPLLGNLEDHTIEVRELQEAEALHLLEWLCRDTPELSRAMESRGRRIVEQCGRLPYSIGLFARWAKRLLQDQAARPPWEVFEDSSQAGGSLVSHVLRAVLRTTPAALLGPLESLASLECAFSTEAAAQTIGVEVQEVERLLVALRDQGLLEVADSGAIAFRLAMLPSPEVSREVRPAYRMHPLLRDHLLANHRARRQAATITALSRGDAATAGREQATAEALATAAATGGGNQSQGERGAAPTVAAQGLALGARVEAESGLESPTGAGRRGGVAAEGRRDSAAPLAFFVSKWPQGRAAACAALVAQTSHLPSGYSMRVLVPWVRTSSDM